ncbi:chondroitin sulfate proteoglycan 5 [Chanos chanos]|uniref:Chondroitin sulfate proteoglycan 5 n=1 Tax=Chanos chanos TaxID=29144 RepID=A0A6J2W4Y2_CHACN|nr:chondroitin sulfate proteoglycan 5 [Chanos chanos]
MNGKEIGFYMGCWRLMLLSIILILHLIPFAHGNSVVGNVTESDNPMNMTSQPAEGDKMEEVAGVTGSSNTITLTLRAARKPRDGEEVGSGMLEESIPLVPGSPNKETVGQGSPDISPDSAETDLLLPHDHTNEFMEEEDLRQRVHTDPPWQTAKGNMETTVFDLDRQTPPTTPSPVLHRSHPDVLTVDFLDPGSHRRDLVPPSPSAHELQGRDPTWSMPENYDYLTPYDDGVSTTPDEYSYSTTTDTYDDDLTTTAPTRPFRPRVPSFYTPDETLPSGAAEGEDPAASPGVAGGTTGSGCRPGYVQSNGTCRSPCDLLPNYCFNGGQCYSLDGTGVFCRCNIQDYIWHKGARCESVITEFQVLCIAIGASALMVLLLFMIIVCFAKKLHVLKTENNKLRKRSSKYRPSSEQHNDNFSLSTIAEGSHPNVRKLCDTPPNLPHARALAYYDNIICQKTMSRYTWECKTKEEPDCEDDPNAQNKLEDPVKAPAPKEDETLNIQNSLTPKHENHKVLGEENSSEVNSLQNNMM